MLQHQLSQRHWRLQKVLLPVGESRGLARPLAAAAVATGAAAAAAPGRADSTAIVVFCADNFNPDQASDDTHGTHVINETPNERSGIVPLNPAKG